MGQNMTSVSQVIVTNDAGETVLRTTTTTTQPDGRKTETTAEQKIDGSGGMGGPFGFGQGVRGNPSGSGGMGGGMGGDMGRESFRSSGGSNGAEYLEMERMQKEMMAQFSSGVKAAVKQHVKAAIKRKVGSITQGVKDFFSGAFSSGKKL